MNLAGSIRFVESVLAEPHWISHKSAARWFRQLIDRHKDEQNIPTWNVLGSAVDVLSREDWAKHPEGANLLLQVIRLIDLSQAGSLAEDIFLHKHWIHHQQSGELLREMIIRGKAHKEIAEHLLWGEQWGSHPEGAGLLDLLIRTCNAETGVMIVKTVFTRDHWIRHPKALEGWRSLA